MTEGTRKVINSFLNKEFPISRIKDNRNRWKRAVIIHGGYIRKNTMTYDWKRGFNITLVAADITQIISNVFGCNINEAQTIAVNYVEKFKI